ncbi:hypothetical protein GCM10027610_024320 [Dactylosporangium cerinum]
MSGDAAAHTRSPSVLTRVMVRAPAGTLGDRPAEADGAAPSRPNPADSADPGDAAWPGAADPAGADAYDVEGEPVVAEGTEPEERVTANVTSAAAMTTSSTPAPTRARRESRMPRRRPATRRITVLSGRQGPGRG